MVLYAGENNGAFPSCAAGVDMGTTDCTGLGPVTGGFAPFARLLGNTYISNPKIWVCASDKKDGATDVQPAANNSTIDWFNISYFYVARLNQFGGTGTVSVAKSYLLMGDESGQSESTLQSTPDADINDNHGVDGRNAMFTDGRVEWVAGVSVGSLFTDINNEFGPAPTGHQPLD